MSELLEILKRHEVGWVGDGPSLVRKTPFFHDHIRPASNPKLRISVINEGTEQRPDWYYRIHEDRHLICCNRHFETAEAALDAAFLWARTMPDALQLRPYKFSRDMQAYTVDGMNDYSDATILEFDPGGVWRRQVIKDRLFQSWSAESWASPEEALAAFVESLKSLLPTLRRIQIAEGHFGYRVDGLTDCEAVIVELMPGEWHLKITLNDGNSYSMHDPAWTCAEDALKL